MALEPGTRVGSYEIVALLGAGGMGAVYRARDGVLRRDVAVKVLPPEFAAAADRAQRFEREARLLATVSHANVAAIYGVETLPPSRPDDPPGLALVLELVDGAGLDERIGARPLPLREATAIAGQIVDALDAAHERGIVHRDLKPANIRLTRDGVVKVLDFGLAKVAATSDPAALESTVARPTESGMVLGTAPYMSPEQARGQEVDKRTDIWAFGCVLYEMLSGRRAFGAATASDTIAAILDRDPDWTALPATTPPAVRRLLERCLAKNPKHRLRDIADARDALTARPPEPGANLAARQHGRFAWLPWALAVVGVAAGAWGLIQSRSPAEATTPEPTLTRLTVDSGVTFDAVLSNDGRLLAYSSTRLGRADLDIWIQQAAGGQPLRLTDDPADDGDPDISPDSSQVVFRSERAGGGAYLMSALGGPARLVADGARQPRFSPDGTRIAYWTGQFRGGPGRSSVFVLPLAGGAPTPVLADFPVAQQPRWSPDGRALLVLGGPASLADAAHGLDLWLVPIDGGAPLRTTVLDRPGWRQAVTLERAQIGTWSEDGLLVAQGGTLWSVPLDAATGQVGDPRRLLFGAASVLSPAGTAGQRVVFAQGFTERVIERQSLADDDSPGRTTRLHADGNRLTRRASSTPDGQLLVFERDSVGGTELWRKDLTTGEQTLVVQAESAGNLSASISADGRRIAYTRNRGPEVPGASGTGYVVDVAGGVPRQVCESCLVWGFVPGRHDIIVTAEDRAVRVLDAGTGVSTEWVAVTDGRIDRPSLSPDGRWLAYRIQRGNEGKVFLGRAAVGGGSAAVQIDEPTTTGRPAGWSLDSRVLYLLLDADGFRCLWAQRVDPGTGRPVGVPAVARHLHDVAGVSTSFANAITAQGFVYEAISMRASLWRLDWPER